MARDKRLETAVKLLGVLDRGSFVATYKYAVLLGLMDLCVELAQRSGSVPDAVTTRQLAEKVVELYWPQTRDFPKSGAILFQNSGRQAKIVEAIARFRHASRDRGGSLWRLARDDAPRFERLVRSVELVLIEMPLPKLQRVGSVVDPFLYTIAWGDDVDLSSVRAHQRGERTAFDNRVVFAPGAAEALVALSGLLRPFVHREWCALVARLNELEESQLEGFLFGVERASFPEPLRRGLNEVQGGRCFYCEHAMPRNFEVDHFVPWSRHPNDAVENLVAAHRDCNGRKRDYLAAAGHLERWWERARGAAGSSASLGQLALDVDWPSRPEISRSIGRSVYLMVPGGTALWMRDQEFEPADIARIRAILRHDAA